MKNAVVLGTFDGLHTGHRSVLELARGFAAAAVTFRLPPKAVMTGVTELLMSPEERCAALRELGVSTIEMLDFNDVRNLSAREFFDRICRTYRPARIVCGFNYRFGCGAEGDVSLLKQLCDGAGIEFVSGECRSDGGEPVSSSRIRALLADGEIKRANRLTYRPFSFTAPVVHGDQRGRTIGFPTANQEYPAWLAPLRHGVYAVRAEVDGRTLEGIANIGLRPTYRTEAVMSETYFPHFSGDLYGKTMTVFPLRFLRDEKTFGSAEELCAAIRNDVEQGFSAEKIPGKPEEGY